MLHLTDAGRAARSRLVDAATTHTPVARLSGAEQRRLHTLLTKALAHATPEPDGVDDKARQPAEPSRGSAG